MELSEAPYAPLRAFAAVGLAWFLSQAIKVIRGVLKEGRFNFRWLFDTGGMPSAHSATVASLATATGLYYGFSAVPFLIALIFAVITMFDAAGVRRAVGRQAGILNKMVDDLYEKGQVPETRLKELLGHTPVEVFTGAFLGIVMSLVICG
jgi:acid phosphatase family membrane protein YuiD